jgi:thioredoxin 1
VISAMTVRLELFYSPYCPHCGKARALLKELAADWPIGSLQLRELDVVEELERAVALGVTRTPALAIDGILSGLVTSRNALEKLLRDRLGAARSSNAAHS